MALGRVHGKDVRLVPTVVASKARMGVPIYTVNGHLTGVQRVGVMPLPPEVAMQKGSADDVLEQVMDCILGGQQERTAAVYALTRRGGDWAWRHVAQVTKGRPDAAPCDLHNAPAWQFAVTQDAPDPDFRLVVVMQGRDIGEPVVQHGPFVGNTQQDIMKAFGDYQRTGFGGWPWQEDDHCFARDRGRFAQHADGQLEEKPLPAPA